MHSSLVQRLKILLERSSLPGKAAHALMMPQSLQAGDRYMSMPTENTKLGGVLLLLYPDEGGIHFPLMLRHDYRGNHAGQVSLPGGKKEDSDPDLVATALRECCEEIGVCGDDVQVIGCLSDIYIHVSDFLVTPVLGYLSEKPCFEPDDYEVKELILASLDLLRDDLTIKRKEIPIRAQGVIWRIDTPYFDIDGHVVWGATAMILSEFKEILKGVAPCSGG